MQAVADLGRERYDAALRRYVDAQAVMARAHRDAVLALAEMADTAGAVMLDGVAPGSALRHAHGRPDRAVRVQEIVAAEAAAATAQSEAAVRGQVLDALRARRVFRDSLRALRHDDGPVMTPLKLRILLQHTAPLDDDRAARVEAMVLGHAHRQTPGQFGRAVIAAVRMVDPQGCDERTRRTHAHRRVAVDWTPGEAMGLLVAELPGLALKAVDLALDEAARDVPADDARTLDQRRADVFLASLLGPGALRDEAQTTLEFDPDTGSYVTTEAAAVEVDAVLDEVDRLLAGIDRTRPRLPRVTLTVHGTPVSTGTTVWWLDGHGPVDPASLPLPPPQPPPDAASYRPTAAQRRYVAERDRTCTFPGCTVSAGRCEIDHARPWPHGPTSVTNLHSVCTRHHRLKTQTLWRAAVHDGRVTWVSPTGARYPHA